MKFVTINHLVPIVDGQEMIASEETTTINVDTIKRIEHNVKHWKQGSEIATKYMIVCEMGKQSWDANARTMNVFLAIYEYYTNELPKELLA